MPCTYCEYLWKGIEEGVRVGRERAAEEIAAFIRVQDRLAPALAQITISGDQKLSGEARLSGMRLAEKIVRTGMFKKS